MSSNILDRQRLRRGRPASGPTPSASVATGSRSPCSAEDARRLAAERAPDLVVVDVYAHAPAMLELSHRLEQPRRAARSSSSSPARTKATSCRPTAGASTRSRSSRSARLCCSPRSTCGCAAPACPCRPARDPGRRQPQPQPRTPPAPRRRTAASTVSPTSRLRLLQSLMTNPGQVLGADLLIERVWGTDGGDGDMLKNVVYRLRRKIEPAQARRSLHRHRARPGISPARPLSQHLRGFTPVMQGYCHSSLSSAKTETPCDLF